MPQRNALAPPGAAPRRTTSRGLGVAILIMSDLIIITNRLCAISPHLGERHVVWKAFIIIGT